MRKVLIQSIELRNWLKRRFMCLCCLITQFASTSSPCCHTYKGGQLFDFFPHTHRRNNPCKMSTDPPLPSSTGELLSEDEPPSTQPSSTYSRIVTTSTSTVWIELLPPFKASSTRIVQLLYGWSERRAFRQDLVNARAGASHSLKFDQGSLEV